jgi:hypothetical protein
MGWVLTPLPTQLKWDFWDTERSRFRAIAFFVSNLRKPEISGIIIAVFYGIRTKEL